MWSDPDWEQMLKESEAISLVQVIEGGRYIARVKVVTTFKGTVTGEFFVTGYNNNMWPKEAIREQSFRNHQQYYLFLKRQNEEPEFLTFLPMLAEETGDTDMKKMLGRVKADKLWHVWTPSSGDLRVEKEKVHYSLLRTSYSDSTPLRDRAEFERFLKAAIAYQASATTDSGLLEQTLQAIREYSRRPTPPEAQESDLANSLASYYLLGGRAYDDLFETIAASKDARARFLVARLLGGIPGERAHKLLLVMLADPNSLVQGEVVRQIGRSDSEGVGAILLERLPTAGGGGIGPQDIMDPMQNRVDGGKIEIIRALGELKYEPAAPALLALLKGAESGYDLKVIAGALEKLGNREYGRILEEPLRTGKIRVYEIAVWARDNCLIDLKPVFERFLQDPPADTFTSDLSSVVEALGVVGDDATAAQLTAYLEKVNVKKVAESHDQSFAQELIGALAALRYRPARSAVEQSFFYWFGVDSAFAAKPELLKTKEQLEHEIERDAEKCLGDFRGVSAHALVFLENRTALVNGSETEARYRFVLLVNVRSPEHPELKAESLRDRLVKAFGTRDGTIGVMRLSGHIGMPSGGNDARVEGRFDSHYVWRYGQYVEAVHEPADVPFVKFLLESGLAKRWDAEDEVVKALKSISDQDSK